MAQEIGNKKYQWKLGMSCNACVEQIENIMKKVNSKLDDDKQLKYTVSLPFKMVTVEGKDVDVDAVSGKLKKWADLKEKSYEYKGALN